MSDDATAFRGVLSEPVRVRARAGLACFTRPEFKTERVSYDVMPPTAALGLLEAVYRKPEMAWEIGRITVLAPVRFLSIRRNEVSKKFPVRFDQDKGLPTLDISDARNRIQRHTMMLRDVDYLIEARVRVLGSHDHADVLKHRSMFVRRLAKGQCFRQPYMGCREFWADLSEPDGTEQPLQGEQGNRPLGMMPLRMVYSADGVQPEFFPALLTNGCLDIPEAGIAA